MAHHGVLSGCMVVHRRSGARRRQNRALLWALTLLGAAAGCSSRDARELFLDPNVNLDNTAGVRIRERGGTGSVIYEGFASQPPRPRPGDVLEFDHVWRVEEPFRGNPMVFVHLEGPDGRRVAVSDHPPVEGKVPFSTMKAGERWLDRHRVRLPSELDSGTLAVLVGLFAGDVRMTVEAEPGLNDGRDRVRAGPLRVVGVRSDLPEVNVPRAKGPIRADGVLDEADWKRAPRLSLSDSLGRNVATRFPTVLRLLWDDENLYVAFEATDEDITERYKRRDDPIYEHEAVELFVMPNRTVPSTGPYVEMQASPTGVIFDASFTGPRQGMNRSWNGGQKVGTQRRGTLDDDRPDERWVSEWVVPFLSLAGVDQAPQAGDEWRMNAFRIEKFREGGKTVGEYTAWSPPRVGDFHAVQRFGRMRFGGN
ncbi:MAG: carbohydrate-binding family 9-like protein [Myxococcota bacterium]